MMNSRHLMLVASALAAAAGMGAVAPGTAVPTATAAQGDQLTKHGTKTSTSAASLYGLLGGGLGSWRTNTGRRARRGWTNAHVQRMARKRRGVAKFKAQSRGRR